MSGTPAAGDSIVALERELDTRLRDHSPREPFDAGFHSLARAWSEEVWSAARALGPAALAPGERERGLALARRPVFVCGLPRSGTTLLRDLLDGHPQLVVVPAESRFYTALERALFGLRADRHGAFLATDWLRQLVNHPPYWLLGRSEPGRSPYVAFARDLAAWWQAGEQHAHGWNASWPLAALALACARRQGRGAIPPGARMWVEKSPGHERFAERIWRDFPAARIIHIVREPGAVLASYKAARKRDWNRRLAAAMTLRQMPPGYRLASERGPAAGGGRYCLVRYEDLAADRAGVMAGVARFLGIDPSPALLEPTIAGMPATNNSSFAAGRPRSDGALDGPERMLLKLGVGRWASRLGY